MQTDLRDAIRSRIAEIGQSEAARRASMRPADICNWLAGRRSISLERQIRLAHACGLTVNVVVRDDRTWHP